VAADVSYSGGPAKRSGPGHPLRQHSEEEMGFELCLHGPLRFCGGSCLLGWVVLQNVIRREDPSISGTAKHGLGPGIRFSQNFCWGISQRHHGVLSAGFCCHHVDSHSGGVAWENELLCMDVVCSIMGYVLLHHLCLQYMEHRWMVVQDGPH